MSMNKNPLDLTGRKILITGATSPIGQCITKTLSGLGAYVVINGRNETLLKDLGKNLDDSSYCILSGDLCDKSDLSYLFEQAVEDGIKLNGLVHAAGAAPVLPLTVLSREKLTDVMNINFFSFIELVRQFSKRKYSNGGSIVGISSIAAVEPTKCHTAYAASKASMNIAASCLAMELVKKNIRINTIMPGAIETHKERKEESLYHIKMDKQLLGLGLPDDVAGLTAFLLSDLARMMTGRSVYLDGGRL